jgi:N-methylhydantoinase B
MGIDAIALEVLRHAFAAVADEMNAKLIRTAYSPNIKERRDCSCALFSPEGELVAQAESIPVHLGAMPYSVSAILAGTGKLDPGDVAILNDPYAGGAHLPDITFVAPVFVDGVCVALVANRAHHADVGGKEPGSVAGDAREIYQEGLRIPPVRLWRRGELQGDLMDLILLNVRTPRERQGDIRAQYASCLAGAERVRALVSREGAERVRAGMGEILDYSERRMCLEIAKLPDGRFEFEDSLDDDGLSSEAVRIRATVTTRGERLVVDFSGSSPQTAGPVNAVLAVTASATYYAVRAATDPSIPPNAGCYRPIEIVAPEGSVVHPLPPVPVVGGNLETSQRIVDVVLGALGGAVPSRAAAASQGTMNNLAIGGRDPRTGEPYTIYETIAGGAGATATRDGADGVQSHMTNTLNTPVEALETTYPLRVKRYEFIRSSGGPGRFRGGLGIRRDLECVGHTARVSLLSDRRIGRPYGLAGGSSGSPGRNVRIRVDGTEVDLPGKGAITLSAGETISIRTPGGGGFGPASERAAEARSVDEREGRT